MTNGLKRWRRWWYCGPERVALQTHCRHMLPKAWRATRYPSTFSLPISCRATPPGKYSNVNCAINIPIGRRNSPELQARTPGQDPIEESLMTDQKQPVMPGKCDHFYGGQFHPPVNGAYRETFNPAT